MDAGMEIILIEDNEDDAYRMLRFLRANFSNNVRVINDGAAAVEFLLFENDHKPKLILLDVVLPTVDGIELYRIIRAEPKERQLSVVMLISSEETRQYLESQGVHPDGFMIKPTVKKIPSRVATEALLFAH